MNTVDKLFSQAIAQNDPKALRVLLLQHPDHQWDLLVACVDAARPLLIQEILSTMCTPKNVQHKNVIQYVAEYAAASGNTDLLQQLSAKECLQRTATNPDLWPTLIRKVISSGNCPAAQYLLTHSARKTRTQSKIIARECETAIHALYVAMAQQNREMVELVVNTLVPPKMVHQQQKLLNVVLNSAALRGDVSLMEYARRHGAICSPDTDNILEGAAFLGHTEVVRLLLELGANPKAKNSAALRAATEQKHQDVFDLLFPVSDPHKTWDDMCHEKPDKKHMLQERLNAVDTHTLLATEVGLSPHSDTASPQKPKKYI